ncbi:MAG: FTR1 family protein [Nitrosopumilus sp.]|uniref:FTR1 family protein n=1 Tax=Nitrosopumilus sp. TaxID=2024843 RepID=UPI00247C3C9F|nr:FTR1 family protein [Nitrosopumilus sp.]MCV0392285.1 FTR1 family protein [Nitrosopumilus sp.]
MLLFRQKFLKLFFVGLISFSLVPNVSISAQSEGFSDIDSSSLFVTKTMFVALDLVKQELSNGNVEGAKSLSKLITEIFPTHLQNLRVSNSEISDEIHILLLDLHSTIGTLDNQQLISDIKIIENLLSEYQSPNPDYGMVSGLILIIVDEQYQIAIKEENETLYMFSADLVNLVHEELFPHTNYDERLRLEIDSFLVELKDKIANKHDFLSVGTLINAINRDFAGHESIAYDKQKLYETIRNLYGDLLIAIDNGDYKKAEELGVEAYLENFEYLEPDIEKVDSELLYSLEWDMREELRDMIRNEQDPRVIRVFIEDSILPNLADAESKVQELGTAGLAEITLEKELKEMGDASEDAKSSVRGEIDFIRDTLQEMLFQYENQDYQSAYVSARTAYLDSYEYVEIPLRAIDPDFTLEVEFQFAQLRNLIKQQASYEEVQEVAISIKRSLDESERLVSGTGTLAPTIAFSSSFAIIFREGLESVLILGAILTYLEASRNNRYKKHVYYGIIAALAATAITWFIASFVIAISGANRELIEAIAALSATGMLFYVSFWVLNKIEHKKWMEFVKAKVWQATTTGSVMVFVMLSFFTVYREGFETVLFYQAMSGFAKYMEAYVGLGFLAGMATLFLIYYVMRKLGRKLPLRALFGLTMGVGAYMSIAFLGNAVRELQILEVIPYTGMIGVIPRLDINLATMTGIYPTLETVVAQIILLGIYLLASAYVLIVRPQKEKRLASMRKSHGAENV